MSRPPRWKQGIAPPDDPLVAGVGALVDEINARAGWPDEPDLFCTQEGRPRIKYVFGFPDGSTTTITHGYGSCHVLELADPGDFPTPDSLVKVGAIEFRETVAAADAETTLSRDGVSLSLCSQARAVESCRQDAPEPMTSCL